ATRANDIVHREVPGREPDTRVQHDLQVAGSIIHGEYPAITRSSDGADGPADRYMVGVTRVSRSGSGDGGGDGIRLVDTDAREQDDHLTALENRLSQPVGGSAEHSDAVSEEHCCVRELLNTYGARGVIDVHSTIRERCPAVQCIAVNIGGTSWG